jgi:hypothetical protein
MNQSLVNKIFISQEESYETPRHGDLMKDFVVERFSSLTEGKINYEEFLTILSDSENTHVTEQLVTLDQSLNNYVNVRDESEEDTWDQVFEGQLLTLLDLIDQNR